MLALYFCWCTSVPDRIVLPPLNAVYIASMQAPSSDGTLRLQLYQLHALTLVHLISGLDEDSPLLAPHAASSTTTITGYTEWVNQGKASLSLGWDFQLLTSSPTLARLGAPRSNIILLDQNLVALDHDAADALLAQFVDTLAWQDITFSALSRRNRQ